MTGYKMRIAFNGSRYAGWQRQSGQRTVQQAVEETLRPIFREDHLKVTASSRTDAGVHALEMTLSFQTENPLPENRLAQLLTRRLPHDIRMLHLETAPPGFNAHADALGKSYVYVIHPGEPDVFLNNLCWNWPDTGINAEVRLAVRLLPGTHDFRSFTGRTAAVSTVRTIYRAELMEFGPLLCFYLSGNGFLYKMVRRLTGFLHEIARGDHSAADLAEGLKHPAPPRDDVTVAPPEGLYLKKVFYTPEEWKSDSLDRPPFIL